MPAPRKPASRPAKPRALSLGPDAMHATIDRLKAIADASGDGLLMEGPLHLDAALLDLGDCGHHELEEARRRDARSRRPVCSKRRG